jgi:hypothetical protein
MIKTSDIDSAAKWEFGTPPNEVLMLVKCDDFRGEYIMKAMRKDYKKPKKGQSPKGFRKGWRWVKEDGEALTIKEKPSAWSYI